jgi:hypothetical protein
MSEPVRDCSRFASQKENWEGGLVPMSDETLDRVLRLLADDSRTWLQTKLGGDRWQLEYNAENFYVWIKMVKGDSVAIHVGQNENVYILDLTKCDTYCPSVS